MKGLETLSSNEKKALVIPDVMPPCPFCGEEVYIGKHSHLKGYLLCCSSKGYGCKLFPSSGQCDLEELNGFIETWKKRV